MTSQADIGEQKNVLIVEDHSLLRQVMRELVITVARHARVGTACVDVHCGDGMVATLSVPTPAEAGASGGTSA